MTETTAAGSQLRAATARRLASGAAVLSLGVLLSTCQLDKLLSPPPGTGTLVVDPEQLTDSAAVGSVATRARSLEILVAGGPDLDWQAQKVLGSPWLLMASNGTAPDTVTVTLNPAGLAVGVYRDTVVLTSNNSDAAPLRVPVQFSVHPCRDEAISLDILITDHPISDADCTSPARPGYYAQRFRFSATAGDSVSIELQATGFDAFIRLDTVTASPAPSPYPPSFFETGECLGVANGDPCIHYLRLPETRDYVLEVTTDTPGATGTIAMSVHGPRTPLPPTTLTERSRTDSQPLAQPGNVSGDTALLMRADVDDQDTVDTLRLEVEVRRIGTAFTGTPTHVSGPGAPTRREYVLVNGLADDTTYHWQARAVDQTGRASAWVSAGGNPETTPDFRVNVTETPGNPTALAQFRENGTTAIALGGVNPTASAVFKGVVTDADPGDQLRLDVEVRPVGVAFTGTPSASSSPVSSGATAAVTVSGLIDGASYHWRARTVDQTLRPSAWVSFGGNPESGTDFSVQLPVGEIVFSVEPSDVVAGAAISPAVVVQALDPQGNLLTSFTAGVKITIATGPVGATVTGTDSVNAVGGIATFANLRLPKAGAGYTLRATSGGLFVTSAAFTVTHAPASKLAFTAQPVSTGANVTMAPVRVTAQDQFDNTATTFTGLVTVALGNNPGGDGVLDGTKSVNAVLGVATFSTLDIDEADTSYTLTASASGLTGATSTPFNIIEGGVARVLFNAEPTTTTAGVNMTTVQVRAVDVSGNTVTSFNGQIQLAILNNPGGGTLLGTNPRPANSGIASFNNLRIEQAGVGYTLLATVVGSPPPVIGSDTSAPFTITPAAPTKLGFTVQPPATTTAGAVMTPAIVVAVQDQFDNTVTSSTANVAIAILNNPGGGTLSGTTPVTASGGLATFGNLSINRSGVGYTLRATSSSLTAATSNAFTIIAGPATQLVFSAPPGNTVAGVDFSPTVQVTALDALGNTATSFTGSVTVAIGTNPPPGGGVLDGTRTVAAVAGVANFPGLNIDEARTGYTLTASATGLAGQTSAAFNITPAAASALFFTVQPSTTTAGQVIAPAVQVTARDQFGNTATGFTSTVTMTIGANPGSGVLGGTTAVAATAGIATFSTLTIDKAGVNYTLNANATGLAQGTSAQFTINPAAATNLVFTQQPTNAVAGATITPAVQVTARDSLGNTVTAFTGTVTVQIGTNPPGTGVLDGTTSVAAVAGVATFSTLNIDEAGNGYTLTATSPGTSQVTSASFNIAGGPATQLVFTVQPPASTPAGLTFSPAVQVTARDQFGNTAAGFTSVVSLAIGTNPPPGGGVLDGTTAVPAVAGVATFSAIDIDEARNGYTLVATSGGLNVTSNPFNIVPGTTTQLAFSVQPPTSTGAGTNFTPAIQVNALDAFGNPTPAFTQTVNVSIGTNPPGNGVLDGTTTVAAVAGVATFSNLNIDEAGTGYTLIAARAGLISDESAPFNITPAPASVLAFTVEPSNAVAGTSIAPAVQVAARDAFGNTVTTYATNITVAIGTNPGSGLLGGATTVTPVLGVATFNNLNINRTGTGYTLVATSGTLTQDVSAPFNIAPGPATQLAFTGQPSAAVAGVAIAPPVQVTARDALGNTATDFVGSVTAAIGTNPGAGVLSGTNPVAAIGGVATFSTLSINRTGTGYTLTANATGLAGATSSGFNITAGPVSAALSTVSAAPTTITASNGASASTITVTARDAQGNPVSGATVVLAATGSGNTVTQPGLTNASGVATGTLSSTVAEAKTVSATVNGVGITQTATVTVSVGATSASASTVGAAPTTIAASNGTSQSTITVTARDALGNPISGATVVLAATGSGNTLTQPAGTTNASGVATGTLSSTAAEGKIVSATINGVGVTQTATVTVTVGTVSAAQSTVSAAPATINASSGTSQSTITVTARDALGNPINGATVVLAATGTGNTLTQPAGTTNALGVATGTISSTDAGSKTVSATANGVAITQTATVTVNAGAVSAAQSTVGAAPAAITASNGASQSTITVTARDAQGNPISGATVVLAATGTGNTVTQPAGTTNASGVATGTLSSTAAAAKTVSATINGVGVTQTAIVTVNPAAVSAAQSLVSAAPATIAASNGTSQSTVTVTARDQFLNPISGATVVLASTGTGNTVTQPGGTTNASGVATGTLSSTVAEGKTVSATINAVGVTQTAAVTVTAGTATHLAFTVQPTNTVAGATITPPLEVTARDQFGNTATGYTSQVRVLIGTNPSSGTLSGTDMVNAVAGVATFSTLSINNAGTGYTLIARQGSLTDGLSNAFNITAGSVSASQSTVSAAPTTITASSGTSQSTITVTARDAQGNPVSGATVVLAATGSGNTVTQPAGTTNASGVATGTLSSTAAAAKTVSATINGVSVTQTAIVTVNPAAVSAAQSLVSAAPGTITASNGTSQSTITVTARDQFLNPISGATVVLGATGTGNTITQPGTTNASGIATGTLSSTAAAAKTVSATINAVGITQTAIVTVNPAAVSAAQSLVSAAPGAITASNGSSQSTITVTVRDQFLNPISGATVVLASSGTGNTVTQPAGTTSASGVATGTLSSTMAEGKSVSATANGTGITQTAAVTVNAAGATQMTISAGDGQSAPAGSVVTAPAVLVLDAFNNPVAGVSVTFTITGGDGTISPSSPATVQTDASGIATITTWTLGVTPGANTIEATSTGLPTRPFTATGT